MDLIFTLQNIDEAAEGFWRIAGNKKVFAFHGEMGSGKTTFIHALCKEKQVKVHMSSPTFSIINEYSSPGNKIYHIDLYRINNADEAIKAGVEECLYSGELCFIEWPEKAENILPDDTLNLFLIVVDTITRQLIIDDK